MLALWDLLLHSAERAPDQLALVDDATERSLDYAALIAEAEKLAAAFAAAGLGPGDRVATVLPGSFDHILAILALHRLGATPALMNHRLDAMTIAELVRRGSMAGAVVGEDTHLCAAVRDALPADAPLWTAKVGMGLVSCADHGPAARSGLPPWQRPEREDEAFIFYTSGTTGTPKGVVLSHGTTEPRIVWLSTHAGLRYGRHNRTLGFMPLSHAIGFYGVLLAMFAYAGTYHVMSAFDAGRAIAAIERHGVNYLFGVPTLLHGIVSAPGYDPDRLRSLDLVLFGGGPIDAALLEHMHQDWPARLVHIYGTTELMCSLYNPDPAGEPKRLRPGFHSRVRVVPPGRDASEPVGPGGEGELLADFDVDTAFSGYLGQPEATAAKVQDGWYRTGDLCRVRPDGDLELIGRVDDVIRTGGESVHPEAVEAVLSRHPAVREAVVFGLADPRWGEIVVAAIVGEARAAELDAHCRRGGLAGFERPKAYYRVDVVPRNAAGKVLRRELESRAGEARRGEDGFLEPLG